MNREEFLRGLENALSGNVPPSVVRDNLRYYDDYIRFRASEGTFGIMTLWMSWEIRV